MAAIMQAAPTWAHECRGLRSPLNSCVTVQLVENIVTSVIGTACATLELPAGPPAHQLRIYFWGAFHQTLFLCHRVSPKMFK